MLAVYIWLEITAFLLNLPIIRPHSQQDTNVLTCKLQWQTDMSQRFHKKGNRVLHHVHCCLFCLLLLYGDGYTVAPTPYRAWGRGARVPHFYKLLGTGNTVSRRIANKKLAKLYWPSRKRSPKRGIVLLEPKKWRGATNRCPHFQICFSATVDTHYSESSDYNYWYCQTNLLDDGLCLPVLS